MQVDQKTFARIPVPNQHRLWSEFGAYSKLKKTYACTRFFLRKICVHEGFQKTKTPCARIFFFEFGVRSKLTPNSVCLNVSCKRMQISKKSLTLFQPQGWNPRHLQTQGLSWSGLQTKCLTLEFGVFAKLRLWVWSVLQTQALSLEFGVFSKVRLWVWSVLQTQALSLECSPNSGFEYGVFSKLRLWV